MTLINRTIAGVLLGGLIATGAGLATASDADAVASYKKGRMLIERGQYQQALVELEKSNAELPSPNTLLLIAHANRELGQLELAASQYEHVIEDAERKVQRGEARFRKTAADARTWFDKLAKDLGRITVTMAGASGDVVVRVAGEIRTPSRVEGDVMVFDRLWVAPGQVMVTADLPGKVSRRTMVEVPRGGPATVVLDLSQPGALAPSASASPTPTPPEPSSRRHVPSMSWIAGGVGVAGVATFAVFGSMARSKANELEACSPTCPESKRSTADAGKRDQQLANIGLAVGGIGLATAVGWYFWQPKGESERLGMTVLPGSVTLSGRF
jgi:hypothetical protein